MFTAPISLFAIYLIRPGSARRGLPFAILGLVVGLAPFVVLWQVQRLDVNFQAQDSHRPMPPLPDGSSASAHQTKANVCPHTHGTVLEVFEWTSHEAIERAHSKPRLPQ